MKSEFNFAFLLIGHHTRVPEKGLQQSQKWFELPHKRVGGKIHLHLNLIK